MSLYVEDYISISIKKMKESGELDNNKYKGKPLDFTDYFKSPSDSRAINRYLADSGFTPPKIQLLNQIKELEEEHGKEPSLETQRKINGLRLKYNMLG